MTTRSVAEEWGVTPARAAEIVMLGEPMIWRGASANWPAAAAARDELAAMVLFARLRWRQAAGAAGRRSDPVATFDLRETLRAMVDGGLTLVTALHDLGTLATVCDAGLMLAGGRVAMTLDAERLQTAACDPQAFERQTIDLLRS